MNQLLTNESFSYISVKYAELWQCELPSRVSLTGKMWEEFYTNCNFSSKLEITTLMVKRSC